MLSSESGNPVIDNFCKAVNLIASKPKVKFIELINETHNLGYAGLRAIFQKAHSYEAQNAQAQAELITTQANLAALQNTVVHLEGQIAARDRTVTRQSLPD